MWGRCPAPSLNFKHNLLKQGAGTADHLTLVRLFVLLFCVPKSMTIPMIVWHALVVQHNLCGIVQSSWSFLVSIILDIFNGMIVLELRPKSLFIEVSMNT